MENVDSVENEKTTTGVKRRSRDDEEEEFQRPGLGGGGVEEGGGEKQEEEDNVEVKIETQKKSGGFDASRLMSKMGYVEGQGLGREGQGIAAPIVPAALLNRGGLGHSGAVTQQQHEWEAREVSMNPHIEWIEQGFDSEVADSLRWHDLTTKKAGADVDEQQEQPSSFRPTWGLQVGPVSIEAAKAEFCDEKLTEEMMEAKSGLDDLTDQRRFRESRSRANPFEQIGNSVFQNRAALKMAELDALFDLTTESKLLEEEQGILYFGDVCAGPGGFTEYMYWRRKWRACGIGMTLAGKDDWKLWQCNPEVPVEGFKKIYGPSNTGDITVEGNLREYASRASDMTKGRGLALQLADGGFDVSKDYHMQEIFSRHIDLGQFLCALMSLRKGGTFVCKLFDCHSKFMAHLLYIMSLHFTKFCIVKPCQSRPANSERFLVASGLVTRSPPVVGYLMDVLNYNLQLGSDDRMLWELIPPLSILDKESQEEKKDEKKEEGGSSSDDNENNNGESTTPRSPPPPPMSLEDKRKQLTVIWEKFEPFKKYLCESNERIIEQQIVALRDVRKYYEDTHLRPPANQDEIQKAAYSKWKLPPPGYNHLVRFDYNPEAWSGLYDTLGRLYRRYNHLGVSTRKEPPGDALAIVTKPFWQLRVLIGGFGPIGRERRIRHGSFFFREDCSMEYVWGVDLPRGTCLLGLYLPNPQFRFNNNRGRDEPQPPKGTFSVVDALFIGCIDISDKLYSQRIAEARRLLENFPPSAHQPNPNAIVEMGQIVKSEDVIEVLANNNNSEGSEAIIIPDTSLVIDDLPYFTRWGSETGKGGRDERDYKRSRPGV